MSGARALPSIVLSSILASILVTILAALGCDARSPQSAEPSCPPCECACSCADAPGQPTQAPVQVQVVQAPAQPAELGELVASAARKMNFGDGAGCLADLDRVAAIDPGLDARMAVSRGQCEMLVGRCQQGKQRVARWYQEETNMHPERAMAVAESLASMRCREGDSSDRDRLLRAFFDLSDGAYMNKKTSAECLAAVAVARALVPKVRPQGPEDTSISGGAQALFHTASACLGRAGDCKAALAVFREFYPDMSAVTDPAAREKLIRESFASTNVHCAQSTASGRP